MIKVPLKSLNTITIVYYTFDKQGKLMYKSNLKWCKALSPWLKYKISDIVAFCDMYRFGVWSIEEWLKITEGLEVE